MGVGMLLAAACLSSIAVGQTETIRVDLKLRTGGQLSGGVVDHTDHGLVIVREKTPYVFAWSELEPDSAFLAKHALLTFERVRAGDGRLRAEDHFQLGLFALRQDQHDLAGRQFGKAVALDDTYARRAREAFREYDRPARVEPNVVPGADEEPTDPDADGPDEGTTSKEAIHPPPDITIVPQPSADSREKVRSAYLTFGAKVREVIGRAVVEMESEHFLIWTDFEPRYRARLLERCEVTYGALCARFGLDPSKSLFLSKCPIFAWRSTKRFRKFARYFDGYGGENAVGYTRSIEENGHVHVVLLRRGRTEADFDRFVCTLVHESTHAFMHRLFSSRLIPHWVNEGYADLTVERVLGDRCATGGNATLLARQFVRYDWPIADLLESTGPLEVNQYPIAHSVVRFLESRDAARFVAFVRDLKSGSPLADALAAAYEGMTVERLEANWRDAIRASDPDPPRRDTQADVLPWARVPTP